MSLTLHPKYDGGYTTTIKPTSTSIVTSDILLVDRIINYAELNSGQQEALNPLIKKFHMKPGSKCPLTEEEKKQFAATLESAGIITKDTPGGSSANTVTTLSKCMRSQGGVNVTFLGATGNDTYGTMIDESMRSASINVQPSHLQNHVDVHTAVSFVIVFPDQVINSKTVKGERAIATYAGNTGEQFAKHDVVHQIDNLVSKSDAVFLQASLGPKYGETIPTDNGHAPYRDLGFMDAMLRSRFDHGKELIFALPTSADFSKNLKDVSGNPVITTQEAKANYYRRIASEANVIVGNGEELSRVYTEEDERQHLAHVLEGITSKTQDETEEQYVARVDLELQKKLGGEYNQFVEHYDWRNNSVAALVALDRLKKILDTKPLENATGFNGKPFAGNKEQVAFITLGQKGAAVIVPGHEIQYIPSAVSDSNEIKNTLGAGDTSYAGFLAGYFMKKKNIHINYTDCGKLGMWLAREKLKVDDPRLDNPHAQLVKAMESADASDPFVQKMTNLLTGQARQQPHCHFY